MNILIQLAWLAFMLGVIGRGLTHIVGFEIGKQWSERLAIVSFLVLIGAEPLAHELGRAADAVTIEVPEVEVPKLGLRSRLQSLAESPAILALGALVAIGHIAFIAFLFYARLRLGAKSADRTRPTLRGRERVEPRPSNDNRPRRFR